MISFYPGPSRVHDEIPKWVKQAHEQGIMSMNHRSAAFVDMSTRTVKLLRSTLGLPANYSVYFVSSATECWEIIAQSLINQASIHIFNGAFGEKWFDYTRRLKPNSRAVQFSAEELLDAKNQVFPEAEIICLTQNETSNGTQLHQPLIRTIQKNNPSALIAVDATSSMAGIQLDFKTADVWFASVQKCFGLPAGLALMCVSSRARERVEKIAENGHYNSLTLINKMMELGQTSCTPNVLGIYLLMRSLEKMKPIKQVNTLLTKRYLKWEKFFSRGKKLRLFISNPGVRSHTVLTLTGSTDTIERVKQATRRKGILLGDGYGSLKSSTFRIANFPALKEKEIQTLMRILRPFC